MKALLTAESGGQGKAIKYQVLWEDDTTTWEPASNFRCPSVKGGLWRRLWRFPLVNSGNRHKRSVG
eukprot:COSAG02_NODE_2751_length_8098_cov_4.799600_12_plen_66_part_00